jgi:hypothetical protein
MLLQVQEVVLLPELVQVQVQELVQVFLLALLEQLQQHY